MTKRLCKVTYLNTRRETRALALVPKTRVPYRHRVGDTLYYLRETTYDYHEKRVHSRYRPLVDPFDATLLAAEDLRKLVKTPAHILRVDLAPEVLLHLVR